jgi:hypothetical protein
MHEVLAVVEFVTESGRWPAGTIGTAVAAVLTRCCGTP